MRREKYTTEEVYKIFQSRGCILLSMYVNNNTPLDYTCGCGKKARSRLRTFKGNCFECGTRKATETNRKHHKGKLYIQTDEFKEKRKEIILKKYGVNSIAEHPAFKEKKEKTCLERYGSKTYLQSSVGKIRSKQSFLTRYGVEYAMQIHIMFGTPI